MILYSNSFHDFKMTFIKEPYMKKIIFFSLFVCLFISVFVICFASCNDIRPSDQTTDTTEPSETTTLPDDLVRPEPVEAQGLKYSVNADRKTCTITSIGKCKDSHIFIPEYIDGYQVTAIGNDAFKNCTSLISVKLPESVSSIGKCAFEGCSSLKDILLPSSLITIGKDAFENCSLLTGITLPDALESIGAGAFKGCTGLTEITIPASVRKIEKDIFTKAVNLHTVYYNSPYSSSGNDFLNTDSIQKVVFGGEIVPEFICKKCDNLTEIIIEDSVKTIGGGAFFLCSALTEITIPDSVIAIGYGAFSFCSSLVNVTLPSEIISIADSTFQNCSALTNITIPDSVTTIGMEAFLGCSSLTFVKLPDSLTSMDYGAFRDCSALTDITLPEGMIEIADNTFKNCGKLSSIIIPKSVTIIGSWAFSYTALKTIYFNGTEEEWNDIHKKSGWNNGIRNYEIIFEDDLVISENEDIVETNASEKI